jgi:ferredoxin
MRWLLGEVFRQDTRGGRTEAEIKQDEFEEGYARDMEEAVAQMQR